MPFGSPFRRTPVPSRPRLERRSVWKKVFCTLPCCGRTYADDDGLAGEYIPAYIHPIPRRLPYYGPIQEDSHVTVSSEMKKPASRVLSFPGEDEGTRAVPSTESSSLIDTIFSGEPSSLTNSTRDESKRHQSQNTPGNKHHRNPSDHHEILPSANNLEEAIKAQSQHIRELSIDRHVECGFRSSSSFIKAGYFFFGYQGDVATTNVKATSFKGTTIQSSSTYQHRPVSDVSNDRRYVKSFQQQDLITTSISLPLSRLSLDTRVSSANKHRQVSDITNIPHVGDSFQHQVMLSAPRSSTPSRQLSGDMPTLRLCCGVSFRSSTSIGNIRSSHSNMGHFINFRDVRVVQSLVTPMVIMNGHGRALSAPAQIHVGLSCQILRSSINRFTRPRCQSEPAAICFARFSITFGRNCVSLIVSGMIKPETNGICYSAPHQLVHYRPLVTAANSAKEVSALGEAAGPSPLTLSVANAIKFGTHNTVTFTTPNTKSVKDGASSCINDHVIPLMCTPVQMSVKHQLFGTRQTAQCSSSNSIFGQLSISHPSSNVVKSPEHHDILMQSISANRRVYDHFPDNGCKMPAHWILNNPIPVDHTISSQNATPQRSIAINKICSPKYTLQPFKPTNPTVEPIGKKIAVKTPGIVGNHYTPNIPFYAPPVMQAWNLATNWMGSNLFHQGTSNVAMVGQPLGQNVNSPLIPTAVGVNPIGGFRYKTPKLTSPAWGTLGGSPTTPLQNNAPNLSISSKALKNVPQYPWKNPFLQNVQTATTAKKSPPRHAQNINIQQQPLYNPFQNYTAGLSNTQQLAVHSPPPKHLKASDYNLPSSCDVIAKSDLEDICNSMQMPTILGSGSFGEVRLMRQLSSRRVCAVKVHHKNRDEKSIIKDLQKETSMLTSLSHLDCIPKLFGISRIGSDTDVPVLVQEFVGDSVTFKATTVADVIDAKGLNGPSSFSVAIQVCRAIKDIHFAGMIHCDLKTDNIMFLKGPSGEDGDVKIKIIDFGKAVSRTGKATYEHFPRNEHVNIRKQCSHIAPEVVFGTRPYSLYTDVYALGLVLANVDTSPGRFLRKLGFKCLAEDWNQRPNVHELIREIDSYIKDRQASYARWRSAG
ncbi:uncharacterized protein [Apostichopus japonicus]|uniref:uncharacterized protein n=1 Tax=Stichopus japonicus TaxID=307972 RepID=UPI003AB5E56D